MNVVRPELLKRRIVAMIKERTWEADTEHELLLAWRKLDQLAHSGDEWGYVEADKVSKYMLGSGFTPFRKTEYESFASYAADSTGEKM